MSSTSLRPESERSTYFLQLSSTLSWSQESVFGDGEKFGQFAGLRRLKGGEGFEAIRDPLGIEKLFYTEDSNGVLHFAKSFPSLLQYKTEVFSVPAGKHVEIGSQGKRRLVKDFISHSYAEDLLSVDDILSPNSTRKVESFRKDFNLRFAAVFSLLRELEDDGWSMFVALSGGLDSSIIAKKAVEYLRAPLACTLDLGRSEDAEQAVSIAQHLGVEHKVFKTNKKEIMGIIGKAPQACQDFRDFNVHCATLNLLLAKNIRHYLNSCQTIKKNKAIVLTGDLMNEFMCDYEGEVIDAKEYYKLPRVSKKKLQSYLINGLDTSDRELSPFRCYGLECVQPYAAVVDLYTRLSGEVLEMSDCKTLVNSFLVDKTICSLIPKEKLRAQVGSRENMGILGLCHQEGYTDEDYLKWLLNDKHVEKKNIPIFVGKYETENFLVSN